MKSKKVRQVEESDFGAPSRGPESNFVLDFLYHDPRRIGSFLSQFDTYGQLLSVKALETAKQTAQNKTSSSISGSAATIVKAEGGREETTSDEESDAAERTYDPIWSNARTFLDYLDERGMLQRDIFKAKMGQFVLVKGVLTILDLRMFKEMYLEGPFKDFMKNSMSNLMPPSNLVQNRRERRKDNRDQKEKPASELDIPSTLLYTIGRMPHSVQFRLYGDGYSVWTTPQSEFLSSSSADLVLKHGAVIRGEWQVLGVLDAEPDGVDGEVTPRQEEFANLLGGSPLGIVAAHLGPMARQMLGRPRSSYGLTPLLIFREVSG